MLSSVIFHTSVVLIYSTQSLQFNQCPPHAFVHNTPIRHNWCPIYAEQFIASAKPATIPWDVHNPTSLHVSLVSNRAQAESHARKSLMDRDVMHVKRVQTGGGTCERTRRSGGDVGLFFEIEINCIGGRRRQGGKGCLLILLRGVQRCRTISVGLFRFNEVMGKWLEDKDKWRGREY